MKKNNFVRMKVQSLTLGEKLQGLRQERRLRIQDLSRKINVKALYIEALEKGLYNDLPTKVYIKGFVRSYARFFGVPEEILLNLFEREYNVYNNINPKDVESEVNRLPKLPRFVVTPRIVVLMIGFVLLCIIGLYLYFSVGNFVSSPWLIINKPLNNSVIKEGSVIISGQTRPNSTVSINNQHIFVDGDGSFSDEINLSQGMNEIIVKSINKFNKESVEKIIVTAEYEIQKKEDERVNNDISIVIRARDKSVWVSIVADGIEVYNDAIGIDDEKVFDAGKSIRVTSSSGLNTMISYDDGDSFIPISEDDKIVRDWLYEGVVNDSNSSNESKKELNEKGGNE